VCFPRLLPSVSTGPQDFQVSIHYKKEEERIYENIQYIRPELLKHRRSGDILVKVFPGPFHLSFIIPINTPSLPSLLIRLGCVMDYAPLDQRVHALWIRQQEEMQPFLCQRVAGLETISVCQRYPRDIISPVPAGIGLQTPSSFETA